MSLMICTRELPAGRVVLDCLQTLSARLSPGSGLNVCTPSTEQSCLSFLETGRSLQGWGA